MNYDIVFLHPPSFYDFRKRPWFPGPIARTVHFSPAFEGIPIGLVSMAEYAERHGYKTKIFNLAEYMLTDPRFDSEDFIRKIQARFFGVDLHFCVHSQGALEIARRCKQHHEDSCILLGGLTASRFSNELIMNHPYIDCVIRGESEVPVLQLLETSPNEKIPNLVYRDNNGRIKQSERHWISQGLDEFDFTRIDLVTPRKMLTSILTELGAKQHWMIPICRGCLHNCAGCGGSRYTYLNMLYRERPSFRSKEKIVEDLQRLSRQGIESVFLFMDARMGGKKYCESLLKTLSTSDIGVKFLTLELFTPGNREFLSQLVHLNNSVRVGLSISPESGSDEVRIAHGRPYTTESLMKTATFCRENGLGLGVFFMFGLAHETGDTLKETHELIMKLTELNLKPGSGPGIRTKTGEMLLLDPGSLAFDNPEKYGYRLLFKSLQDYINGLSSPAWTDWLSYETEKLARRELLELPIYFRDKLIDFYYSRDLMSKEQAELEHAKVKMDRTILDELERIRNLKNAKKKSERYMDLHRALKDYDRGELSALWRLKKKLRTLHFSGTL